MNLNTSYSQFAVFDRHIDRPFNDWTDEHVAQGFSWRPGSVSFRTLDDSGKLSVETSTDARFDPASSTAIRVVRVPFTVPHHGELEIGSIGDSAYLYLEPGEYELTFEHGRETNGLWAKLYFRRTGMPVEPIVLRADAALDPGQTLVMKAEPA
jgi:Competence protein J (ComJ)